MELSNPNRSQQPSQPGQPQQIQQPYYNQPNQGQQFPQGQSGQFPQGQPGVQYQQGQPQPVYIGLTNQGQQQAGPPGGFPIQPAQQGQSNRPQQGQPQPQQGAYRPGNAQEIAMANRQPNQQNYDIPPPGYIAPRYQRQVIPASNDENATLSDSYQRCLYTVGDFCGAGKAACPCCFCVDYPYFQVDQGFIAINERFGKYVRTEEPGLVYFNPCTDKMYPIDCKQILVDCPRQVVMTKDNIMCNVDATAYFRIVVPRKSFYYVDDVFDAVKQITLATIKNMAGGRKFQDLLVKRDELKVEIEEFVDRHVWEWVIGNV